MARKGQPSVQDSLDSNEDFENYLNAHFDHLICLEVYSEFCGYCLATGNAVRKSKLEIGGDLIAMAKAPADNIDALVRFRDKSEPIFLFIMQGKLTRVMFGANSIELCRLVQEELNLMKKEIATGEPRPKYDIDQLLPMEAEKIEEDLKTEQVYIEAAERLRVLTLAARKERVCNRLSKYVRRLNFILFLPHCHQAHYDLYEKWDNVNINVSAKETFQLTPDTVKEALYMSDVDPNEAAVYAMCNGECLVVLFKMFDTDNRDFVKLMRQVLYEDIPVPKEDVPSEKQLPPIPAYERYASISKTAREVRRDRYEAKMQKLREEKEEYERYLAQQARLEREAEEDRLAEEKRRMEEERFARIQAGLPADPEPVVVEEPEAVEGEGGEEGELVEGEVTDTTAATEGLTEGTEDVIGELKDEETVAAEEEFHSDVSVEGEEYIPPGGLFVPGLYVPPNEQAKANGLTMFFPKIISTITAIESEFLPPHVLVMFTVDKRHEVQEIVAQYKTEIINMGIFKGDDPANCEHVAFTVKQYDKMERLLKYKDRLAVMVSRKRSLPLLQLAGLNPVYISSDLASGEKDCLTLFPVGYGDDYVEEESLLEEEVVGQPEVQVQDVEQEVHHEEPKPEEEEDEEA